jgi:hypothetical protein
LDESSIDIDDIQGLETVMKLSPSMEKGRIEMSKDKRSISKICYDIGHVFVEQQLRIAELYLVSRTILVLCIKKSFTNTTSLGPSWPPTRWI